MTDAVLVQIEDGVADVRLNRPEKRNAVDSAIVQGLLAAISQIVLAS